MISGLHVERVRVIGFRVRIIGFKVIGFRVRVTGLRVRAIGYWVRVRVRVVTIRGVNCQRTPPMQWTVRQSS